MPRLVLMLVGVALLSGCIDKAQFESSKSETGALYVVDKWSGKVSKVIGNQLVELPKVSLQQQASQNSPKVFKAQSPTQHLFEVAPKIKFRGDKLLYKVTLKESVLAGVLKDLVKTAEEKQNKGKDKTNKENLAPWYKSIEKSRDNYKSKLGIAFDDSDGFEITAIDLSMASFTRIIDADGNAAAYEVKGSQPISKEDYKFIENWSLTWNF